MLKMKKIKGSYRDARYRESVQYKRIRTEELSTNVLKIILRRANVKDPNVLELSEFWGYGYSDKTSIFINKLDGRIYSEVDNAEARKQALILLKILKKFSLVEGFVRKQSHSTYNLGNTSKELRNKEKEERTGNEFENRPEDKGNSQTLNL